MATLKKSSGDFALNLLRKLSGDGGSKNAFFSPASISVALAMTYGGAAGKTKKEMEAVLFGGLQDAKVHEGMAALIKALNPTNQEYTLHTANRLYAQEDFEFRREFLDLCSDVYQSSLESVNFVKNADTIRSSINKWVETITKDRIKELIAPGVLTDLTRLVLVNAIYFKGTWRRKFSKDQTQKRAFTTAANQEIMVDMMRNECLYGYAKGNGKVEVLQMAYEGSDGVSMFVFLPKKELTLDAWLASVNGKKLCKLMGECSSTKVRVTLPKWKLETSFNLKANLIAQGMKEAFDESRANFSGMVGGDGDKKGLFISDVIHKAFIEVDEEGSEAAAATAVRMQCCSASVPRPAINFCANRPFAFAIAKEADILFLGRCDSPNQ